MEVFIISRSIDEKILVDVWHHEFLQQKVSAFTCTLKLLALGVKRLVRQVRQLQEDFDVAQKAGSFLQLSKSLRMRRDVQTLAVRYISSFRLTPAFHHAGNGNQCRIGSSIVLDPGEQRGLRRPTFNRFGS